MCRRGEPCPKTKEEDQARIRKNLETTQYDISNYAESHPLFDLYSAYVMKNAKGFADKLCRGSLGEEYIMGVQEDHVKILTLARALNEAGQLVYRGFAQSEVRYTDLDQSGVELHIHTLCSMKDTKLGGPILKSLEVFAGKGSKIDIESLDSVPNAVGFYEKMGFTRAIPADPAVEETSNGLMTETDFDLVPMLKKYGGGGRMRLKTLRRSHKKEKKWDAVFVKDGRTKIVPFGQKGYSDYTKHRDKTRRQRYIDRHSNMGENWRDPATPGALSRYILWNKKTVRASLADFRKRFHV
jgi:hypothetical protein